MTRKQIIDSYPLRVSAVLDSDPLKDLSIGGPKKRRVTAPSEDERQLLAALQAWMKWPKQASYRDRVIRLMDAHESRAYLAAAQ